MMRFQFFDRFITYLNTLAQENFCINNFENLLFELFLIKEHFSFDYKEVLEILVCSLPQFGLIGA